MIRAWRRLKLLLEAWLLHGHWPALAELVGWLALGAVAAGLTAVALRSLAWLN